jgi:hypothetical protein
MPLWRHGDLGGAHAIKQGKRYERLTFGRGPGGGRLADFVSGSGPGFA